MKLKREFIHTKRALLDYVADPLFVGSDNYGLVLARVVWFGWFVFLLLSTALARHYSEPMSDIVFAQSVGIVSAAAIFLTIPSRALSPRLHTIMLALSCVVFMTLQRPAAFTPHGTFLRTFGRVQVGMPVEQVRSILFSYQASDDHYKRQQAFVNSEAARQWWFHANYSGNLHFRHAEPEGRSGVYDITFKQGKVIATYVCNK
ncbi:MAG: hypothetical protein V4671_26415 [Armatimonadota bacterium]